MPNNAYKRGAALEYLWKDKLEKQGYFVVRAAGSHGVADLVAILYNEHSDSHEIGFISCKIPQYAPPAERKALLDAAAKYGAVAMMTVKDKSGKWILQTLDA